MITIFTQNCALINISNFEHIIYTQDSQTQEYMITLDDKYILGKYELQDIPHIIAWIGSSIAQHKVDENLCISMPMSNSINEQPPLQEENADAKDD